MTSSVTSSGDYVKRMEKAVLLANVKINELQKDNAELKLRLDLLEAENRNLVAQIEEKRLQSSSAMKNDNSSSITSTVVVNKKRSMCGDITQSAALASDSTVEAMGSEKDRVESRSVPLSKKIATSKMNSIVQSWIPGGGTTLLTSSSANKEQVHKKSYESFIENQNQKEKTTSALIPPNPAASNPNNNNNTIAISSSDDDDDWLVEGLSAAATTQLVPPPAGHASPTIPRLSIQENATVNPSVDDISASTDAEVKLIPGHDQLAAMSPSVATLTIVQKLTRQNIRQAATLLVHYAPSIVSKSLSQNISSVFNRKERLAELLEHQLTNQAHLLNPSMKLAIDFQILKGLRQKIGIGMTLMNPRPTSPLVSASSNDSTKAIEQSNSSILATTSSSSAELAAEVIRDEENEAMDCRVQEEHPAWSSLTDGDFVDRDEYDDKKRISLQDSNREEDGVSPEQGDGGDESQEEEAAFVQSDAMPSHESTGSEVQELPTDGHRKIMYGPDAALLVKTALLIQASIKLNLSVNIIALLREISLLVTSRRLFASFFQLQRGKESFRHPYIGSLLGVVQCCGILQPLLLNSSSSSSSRLHNSDQLEVFLMCIELSIQGYEENFPIDGISSTADSEFFLAQTLMQKMFIEYRSLMELWRGSRVKKLQVTEETESRVPILLLQSLEAGFSEDIDCKEIVDKMSQAKLASTGAGRAALSTCLFHMLGPLAAIHKCNQLSVVSSSIGTLDLFGLSASFLRQIHLASMKCVNQDLPTTWTEIFYASTVVDEPVLMDFNSFSTYESGIDIYQVESCLIQDFKRRYEITLAGTADLRSLLPSIQLLSSLLESILSLSYDNEIGGWKFSDSGGGQTLYEKLKSKFQLTKDRLRRTSLAWYTGIAVSDGGPKSWTWLYFLCGSVANTMQNGRSVLADAVGLVDHCYNEIVEALTRDPALADVYSGLLTAAVQLEPVLTLALVEKFVWLVTCSLRALLSLVTVKMNATTTVATTSIESCPLTLDLVTAEIVRVLLSIPAPWSGSGIRSDMAGEIAAAHSATVAMNYRLQNKSIKSLASTLLLRETIERPLLPSCDWKASIRRKLPAFVINLDFRFGRWRSMSTMLSQPAGRGLYPIRVPGFNGVLIDSRADSTSANANHLGISESDVSLRWDNSLHHHFDANCKTDTRCAVSTTERACAASHLFTWRLLAGLVDDNRESSGLDKFYRPDRVALFQEISRTACSLFGNTKSFISQWPKSMPHRNILGKDSLQHWFIVLEDDAIALSPKYSHYCNIHESIVSLVERLPPDCDICYLGYLPNALHRKQKAVSCVGNRFVKVNYILGLHSYVIKESAVTTLLSNLPITGPVDCFVARLIYENYLVAYALVDPIFKQQLSLTQTGQMSSDVRPSGYDGRRRNHYKKSMQYHKK